MSLEAKAKVAPGLRKCADVGLRIGRLAPGPLNAITDVPGVRVGHETLDASAPEHVHTGVTAIVPHGGDVYTDKLVAAAHVINGHGKTIGIMQIQELGALESPIVLTNTFAVSAGFDAVLDYLMERGPGLRRGFQSINPVVAECNDSLLSAMQQQPLTPRHVRAALESASSGPVAQGAVGAGRGMSLFELKGGIGTASRVVLDDEGPFVLGALVLTNFGTLEELTIAGHPVGGLLLEDFAARVPAPGGGSVVVVLATDAPASDRQLMRIARRVQTGLARTGGSAAHDSGEVVIAFSTATRLRPDAARPVVCTDVLTESSQIMNALFTAAADATEEATLNALFNAETVLGRGGAVRYAFPLDRLGSLLEIARRKDHQ